MRMHCFCAYPGCCTGPLVGVDGQRIDFSDFYGAGKVSALTIMTHALMQSL
jgi:hypothetical protein